MGVVETFMEMVQIDSESGEEKEFLDYLAGLFARELGAETVFDGYGNLVARVPAAGCSGKAPMMLAFHGDTVKPGKGIKPRLVDGVVRSAGDTILGADDKAGVAEAVEAVRTSTVRPPLELVVTREEELGLVGARHFDESLVQAKIGFVLDSDVLDGIIIGGPSHVTIDVEITGRAAHAGMEPEKGISAIKAAAHAISILPLGRLDHESTANVGVIEGGRIRNGIPETCTVRAECRSLNHDKCMATAQAMQDVFEASARAIGARADVKATLAYRASHLNEDARAVKMAADAIRRVGLTPEARVITGGTDAAMFNAKGIETVVLGIGAAAEHSNDEHIAVADMELAVRMVQELFRLACA